MLAFKITVNGPIIILEPLNQDSGAFAVQAWGGMYDPQKSSVWIKVSDELETIKRLFWFNEVQFEVIDK